MNAPLISHLQARIRESGPIPFRDFMEEVLYHPDFGYYTTSSDRIGREGDFLTASDLDPIFGELLARQFFAMSESTGVPPEAFTIVELGAGRGLLAREVLRHHPFPYCIVERSGAMRESQRANLAGLRVEWLEALPEGLTGCIFSNEFFDALPVRRIVRRGGRLREIYVTAEFREIEGDLQEALDLPITEGQLADISTDATAWIRQIASSLRRGYHIAIDYGYEEREFYARPRGSLMCYWNHQAVEDPYVRIGEQDMTAHINFSDLMNTGASSGLKTELFTTQMDFLIRMGILRELEMLAPARNAAAVQRLMALKKLVLPGGMGERFKVLLQRKMSD